LGQSLPDDPALYFSTHVFVCCNRREPGHERGSCAEKGAEALRDYMKAQVKALKIRGVRINQAGCLDRCELGPCAVMYPEGVWYRLDSKEAVDAVLEKHVAQGGRVQELMLPAR